VKRSDDSQFSPLMSYAHSELGIKSE
jgi:hypothetical protein